MFRLQIRITKKLNLHCKTENDKKNPGTLFPSVPVFAIIQEKKRHFADN